jgi:EAL domain-containing protein (putative c-di-GMP-specific phosphodiesterase class I)
MDDPVTGREVLSRLAAQGLRVVVDEFGSGYTSVSTLAGLDISGLKIDRSFVSTLADVPGDVAVVRSTVQLAHELGLEVAAEGVADAASLAVLADLGCDHVQGAHLSPPVTIDELADRVESLESALAGWVASAEATLG